MKNSLRATAIASISNVNLVRQKLTFSFPKFISTDLVCIYSGPEARLPQRSYRRDKAAATPPSQVARESRADRTYLQRDM